MSPLTDKCEEVESEDRMKKNGNPFCKVGGCERPILQCLKQGGGCANFHDECTEEQNALRRLELARIEKKLAKNRKNIKRLETMKKVLDSQVGGTTIGCSFGALGCFIVIAATMISIGLGILMCKYAWIFLKYCWNLAV